MKVQLATLSLLIFALNANLNANASAKSHRSSLRIEISEAPVFNFGAVGVGGSIPWTFKLQYFGKTNARSLKVGFNSNEFEFLGGEYPGQGGTCAKQMMNRQTCTVVVAFHPHTTGSFSGQLKTKVYDGKHVAQNARAVEGTGAPVAALVFEEGSAYNFGQAAIDSTTDRTFVMSNTGGVTATSISGGGLSAPFGFKGGSYPGIGGTCAAALAASANCTLVVTYYPTLEGTEIQNIGILFHNGAREQSATIALMAMASKKASLRLNGGEPIAFDYVNSGGSATKIVTLTNAGEVPAAVINSTAMLAPYGFTGGMFPGTGGTCLTYLSPATTCTLALSFAPASAGAFNSSLSLSYFDGAEMQTTSSLISGAAIAQ